MNNGNLPPSAQNPQGSAENDIELTLKLKLSVVNTIIMALDEVPHKYSRGVIDAIHQQATEQLKAASGDNSLPRPDLNGSLADKVIN